MAVISVMIPPLELDCAVAKYIKDSLFHKQIIKDVGEETCLRAFENLLKYLSTPPANTTLRINILKTTPDNIKNQVESILIKQYADKGWPPPAVTIHSVLSDTLVIQNCGPCDVKQVAEEVIIDLSCGAAVLRGADIYIQGILAATPGMKTGDEVSVYVDLDRGCRKGLVKPYQGRKVFVGNGLAFCSRQDVFCANDKQSGVGIQMTRPLYQSPSLSGLIPDLVFAQNLPSVVCSPVLDPQPEERVLDMCAAPGGKTSHIATLMRNKGRLVALDKSKNKLQKIKDCCQRWGIDIVDVYAFDATKSVDPNAVFEGSPPYPRNCFHRVLLDAPCSALGQRPSIKNHITLAEVRSYPPLQRKLFSKAVELLAPGGTLVYSTCTLPMDENEDIVAWALQEFPELSLAPQNPHLGGRGWPHPNLSSSQCEMLQRFGTSWASDLLPSNNCISVEDSISCQSSNSVNCETIGFFIAKFIKHK